MWPPRATGRKPQLGPLNRWTMRRSLPCNWPATAWRSEKHTAVLNAANEQAVHAFLEHRLPYLGIVDTVKAVLDQMDAELRGNPLFTDVEEMNQLELEARRRADDLINKQ